MTEISHSKDLLTSTIKGKERIKGQGIECSSRYSRARCWPYSEAQLVGMSVSFGENKPLWPAGNIQVQPSIAR